MKKKTLNDLPITLLNVGGNYTAKIISPQSGTVNATVEGSSERIASLKAEDLSFTADVSGYGEGTFKVKLDAKLPQYIYLLDSGTDGTVQVKITVKDKPATVDPTPSTGGGGEPPPSTGHDAGSPSTSPGTEVSSGTGAADSGNEGGDQSDNSTNSP
ncbi:hypothetical protein AWM70_16300 [Paenibacillus yonginensis]|uniref:Uncharacterized protein n=1 Tax=Paenibacillus yonginensis TaxID=1462996 RepID=A0A1B1N3E8_9BACL|nr:CdaR family protein [Paenibacillus yonginensis]ANS75954.1 hypothetical protein AWM70_16300 [Paenibacillus yonginensis]